MPQTAKLVSEQLIFLKGIHWEICVNWNICACEKTGIEPPIFLSIDKLDTRSKLDLRNAMRNYMNGMKQLRVLLKEKISAINPDLIITFGPDGGSAHSEHIVIGSAVTQLLLAQGWVDKYPLYYVAWRKEPGDSAKPEQVNEQYLSVRVDYTQEDEYKSIEAVNCYKT